MAQDNSRGRPVSFTQSMDEDSNLLNNLNIEHKKNFGEKSMNIERPNNIKSETRSPFKCFKTIASSLKGLCVEESRLKNCSTVSAGIVLSAAIIVISLTNTYPNIVIPSKMKSIAEDMDKIYENERIKVQELIRQQLELERNQAVEAERRKYLNPKLRRQDIAKLIYNSVYSTDVTQRDLTAADELVRGLTFDKYEEKAVSQVLIGIKTSDFETLVNRISTRHSIPADKKEGILDGILAEQNTLKIKEFKFNVGTDSKITYCKIATIKTSETHIDMALMLFHLDFKLTPTIKETVTRVWLLSLIPWGTEREIEIKERNLSELDQNKLLNFFRAKALQGFTKEYPSVTQASESNHSDGDEI